MSYRGILEDIIWKNHKIFLIFLAMHIQSDDAFGPIESMHNNCLIIMEDINFLLNVREGRTESTDRA